MATSRRESRDPSRRRSSRRPQQEARKLPYSKRNWQVFAAGIGVILLGYILLMQPPVDGVMSLSLAPILLVLGYCVIIPIALLLGDKEAETEENVGG